VTLDPKENFCGCGGRGHLEGILGYRAMRLRFLIWSRKKFSRTQSRRHALFRFCLALPSRSGCGYATAYTWKALVPFT